MSGIESTEAMAARSAHRAELGNEWAKQHGFSDAEIAASPGLELALDSFVAEKLRAEVNGVTDLGEWRSWKLEWRPGCYVFVTKGKAQQGFQPGITKFGHWVTPECANAVLTAFRRAVARKLTTCPAGWEWMMEEPMGYAEDLFSSAVFLGRLRSVGLVDRKYRNWTDPSDNTEHGREAKRRAAMLGLTPAKPAPSVEEQLAAALRRVDELVNAGLVDKAEIERLRSSRAAIAAHLRHGRLALAGAWLDDYDRTGGA